MNVRVLAASLWLPRPLRKKNMGALFRLTARAFGEDPPAVGSSVRDLSLQRYAIFTRKLVEKAIATGSDLAAIRTELRREAFSFGESVGRRFRLRRRTDALRALKLAYKAMGIALTVDGQGRIIVSRCFFSRFYAPETCRVVAALDEGLMAGMLGEGDLEFQERITDGQTRCRAVFRLREGSRP